MALYGILASVSVFAQSLVVDYKVSYASTSFGGDASLVFSSALDNSPHILSESANLTSCPYTCSQSQACLGYTEFASGICRTLDDLGEAVVTNETTVSFTKYTRYDIREKDTIEGSVWTGDPAYSAGIEYTLYLDLNHNGEYDQGEPINTTVNKDFIFHNISHGNYLVREIQTDSCIQLWPGVWGSNLVTTDGYTGYVDSIVQYYHDGHPEQILFNGGFISNSTTIVNAPPSYILGDTPDTYLSFEPGYGIVFAFLTDVIEDGPGSDIIIQTYGDSTTNAYVSVSYNNINYTRIGILDNDTHRFDLGNYSGHVAYVKLEFFENENNGDLINIVSIRGLTTSSAYSPPYAAYVSVPQYYSVIFVKDCHYYYGCYTYCAFTRLTFDYMDSCMVGCELWEETGTCDCQNFNVSADIPFYGEIYHANQCVDGCAYKINENVYPDYLVKMNASGRSSHITSEVNCDEYDISGLSPNGCIMDTIDSCSRQPSCEALSLDNHVHGYLYNDHHYVHEENSYFIVKRNNSLMRFTTPTSTITSTVTTSPSTTPTLSQTTTLTSSQTSSQTSTQTSSQTSTQTSTQTSSQTSTQTSSQTTSETSTQTSTQTSSQTSTQTTSQTSSQTSTQTSTQTTTILPVEDESMAVVRDTILATVGVFIGLAIIVILFLQYRRKNQPPAKEGHEPYMNPIYDDTFGNSPPRSPRSPASPKHNTFFKDGTGSGSRSPSYMDVAPEDYADRPVFESPTYLDVVSTETNV